MWTLAKGGHTWPGGDELFASDDIDATVALWEFFDEQRLP
jgi:poly(3-hydroxybutyrate) depolymerase